MNGSENERLARVGLFESFNSEAVERQIAEARF